MVESKVTLDKNEGSQEKDNHTLHKGPTEFSLPRKSNKEEVQFRLHNLNFKICLRNLNRLHFNSKSGRTECVVPKLVAVQGSKLCSLENAVPFLSLTTGGISKVDCMRTFDCM